ncbi:hypothetical protein ACFLRB_02215, partial [Acidobacteriota bacterium]
QGIKFDQVAMVDADTLVHPDCPDFFKIAADRFCVVRDNRRSRWVKKASGYMVTFFRRFISIPATISTPVS